MLLCFILCKIINYIVSKPYFTPISKVSNVRQFCISYLINFNTDVVKNYKSFIFVVNMCGD